MHKTLKNKYHSLVSIVSQYERAAVAFSGGVDSTLLARVVKDTLGDNGLAVTVDSAAYAPDSIEQTRSLAREIGIAMDELPVDITTVRGFIENSPERCYHCKLALFTLMLRHVGNKGIPVLFDGSNVDDDDDFRPGKRALAELGIVSPLRDAGLTKNDIREISRELGLPTWNMPSFACLASRFPYGTRITPEMLKQTWKAERVLREQGFTQYRVRNHGDIARIEVPSGDIPRLVEPEVREEVTRDILALGFSYVALDLKGYRTGSMNEVLDAGQQSNG